MHMRFLLEETITPKWKTDCRQRVLHVISHIPIFKIYYILRDGYYVALQGYDYTAVSLEND